MIIRQYKIKKSIINGSNRFESKGILKSIRIREFGVTGRFHLPLLGYYVGEGTGREGN